MFLEAQVPTIKLKPANRKQNPPPHESVISQIRQFIAKFLATGEMNELQAIQQLVRYICLEGHGEILAKEVADIFMRHVQETMCVGCSGDQGRDWRQIVKFHQHQVTKIQFLAQLLQQLEGRIRPGLFLSLFYKSELSTLESKSKIIEGLSSVFFQKVYEFRQGQGELQEDVLEFFQMSVSIGLFNIFKGKYELVTNDYYEQKRERILKSSNWLMLVEKQLRKEAKLAKILGSSPDTLKTAKKELIKETLHELLGVVAKLVHLNDTEQLKLVWKYVKLVGEEEALQKIIQQNIQLYEESLKKLGVEPIICDKLKLLSICESCFENNRQIIMRVETSFQNIFSRQSTLANEMMAQYLIQKLRSSMISEQEEAVVFEMFKTNPSKDLLMEQYKDLLAKQILMGAQNLSSHVAFVSRVSHYSGNLFTKSLETMLHDVWAEGRLSQFTWGKLGCRVLNKHQWPKIDAPPLILPDELTTIRQDFLQQYLKVKPNQELKWIHWLSDVTLDVDGQQLLVSEVQAAIIFYIARAIRPMKKHQLATAIQLDTHVVASAVQPLKMIDLIVQDRNEGLEISYENIQPYRYSKQYQNPPKSRANIIMDRALTVEATIVRIMKKKKVLETSQLIKQVLAIVRKFKPTIEQINICIKTLASKQYIQLIEGVVKYRS